MVSLLAAFQFLTVAPAFVRRAFTAQELGHSVGWYPLVGLALGGLLLGLDAALRLVFPPGVVTVLLLAVWMIATRALHVDGFMDACDGLFGGFTPERRLEIMRDSRVGAFGVVGGVLLVLVKAAAIYGLADRPAGLLLAPVLARSVMSVAIAVYPYAREQGLGRAMKDNARWPQAALAIITALLVGWFAGGWAGLAAAGLAGLVLLVGAWFVLRRIPGLTGDIYGALCEAAELAVLLFFTVEIGF